LIKNVDIDLNCGKLTYMNENIKEKILNHKNFDIKLKGITLEEILRFADGLEIWRPCPEFKQKYEISHLGNCRNKATKKLIKPYQSRTGYLLYFLSTAGKNHGRLIHRLVAEAFLIRLPDKTEVNHLDFDKTNNTIFNVEWTTKRENTEHAMEGKRYNSGCNAVPDGQAWRIIDGKRVLVTLV